MTTHDDTLNADARERFSLLDLDDAPRRNDVDYCPSCGKVAGSDPRCPVCNAYNHAEARRIAHAEPRETMPTRPAPPPPVVESVVEAAATSASAITVEEDQQPERCECHNFAIHPSMFDDVREAQRWFEAGVAGVSMHHPNCRTQRAGNQLPAQLGGGMVSFDADEWPNARRRGGRPWCRYITRVNNSGTGVRRFEGAYIEDGADSVMLKVGTPVIIVYSMFNPKKVQRCRIHRVTGGGLELVAEYEWRGQFDQVVQAVRGILHPPVTPALDAAAQSATPAAPAHVDAVREDALTPGQWTEENETPFDADVNMQAALRRIAGEGQSLSMTRRERREQRLQQFRTERAEVASQAPATSRVAMTAGNVVAGAAEVSDASLFGFRGGGELARSAIAGMLDRLGMDESYMPRTKSAHHHAGKAVSSINHSGTIGRSVSRGKKHGRRWQNVVARWKVGTTMTAKDDDGRFGDRLFYVALTQADQLEFEFNQDADQERAREVADKILGEYNRTMREEVYRSTDVTDWLHTLLVGKWRAARLGGNWYVRSEHAQECERLLEVVSMDWGSDWLLPSIPVTTTQNIRIGIARGFVRDVRDLMQQLESARAFARKNTNIGDLGPQAAASWLAKLGDVAERARSFADVLGVAGLEEVRKAARAYIAELEPLSSTAARRSANIWDDLVKSGEVAPY